MTSYYDLPSKSRQFTVVLISIVGYVALVVGGDFLFPDLEDTTKKTMTQVGLVLLFIAALCAGLPFVWSSKARHNQQLAQNEILLNESRIPLLEEQARFLQTTYQNEINQAIERNEVARQQLASVESLPHLYEWSGSLSLILVTVGTLLCFIGAG